MGFSLRFCYRFAYKPDVGESEIKFGFQENCTTGGRGELKVAAVTKMPIEVPGFNAVIKDEPLPEVPQDMKPVAAKSPILLKSIKPLPHISLSDVKLRPLTKEEVEKFKNIRQISLEKLKLKETKLRQVLEVANPPLVPKSEPDEIQTEDDPNSTNVMEVEAKPIDLENVFEGITFSSSDEKAEKVLSEHEYFDSTPPWWSPVYNSNLDFPLSIRTKCHLCQKPLHDALALKQAHMQTKHPDERKHLCDICGKLVARMLSEHKKLHFPVKSNYECLLCGKQFVSAYRREIHVKEVHHVSRESLTKAKRKFACDICKMSFPNKKSIRTHINRQHTKNATIYHCMECPYKGYELLYLQRHVKTMHAPPDELPFACTTCGKRFLAEQSLRIHTKVHSDKRSCVCEICGKAYKHKCDLGNHYAVHTGQLMYSCRFCGKKFQDRGNKNAHQRRMHPAELAEYKRDSGPIARSRRAKGNGIQESTSYDIEQD